MTTLPHLVTITKFQSKKNSLFACLWTVFSTGFVSTFLHTKTFSFEFTSKDTQQRITLQDVIQNYQFQFLSEMSLPRTFKDLNSSFLHYPKILTKTSIPFIFHREHSYTYDVRCFLGIFDLPTYLNQMVYYISLFSKIRCSLTYLPTQKSDVIYECSHIQIT